MSDKWNGVFLDGPDLPPELQAGRNPLNAVWNKTSKGTTKITGVQVWVDGCLIKEWLIPAEYISQGQPFAIASGLVIEPEIPVEDALSRVLSWAMQGHWGGPFEGGGPGKTSGEVHAATDVLELCAGFIPAKEAAEYEKWKR